MNNIAAEQARKFAAEYAKDLVPAMLKTIEGNRRWNTGIMYAAMIASVQHMVHFLTTTAHLSLLGAILVVGAFDIATARLVKTISTPGMARKAKVAAMWALPLPVGVSMTMNIAGSSVVWEGLAYAGAVALIPVMELVSSFVKPDFTAMIDEATETAPVTTTAAKCPEGCTCGRHNRKARKARKCTKNCTCGRHARKAVPALTETVVLETV
jgi:hypothetical protein